VGRPARDAMDQRMVEKFGGAPEDHKRLNESLWMLAHGATMLIIGKTILPTEVQESRATFTAAVAALLEKSAICKAHTCPRQQSPIHAPRSAIEIPAIGN